MAEPQPATISEGVSDPHAPTSTAEDRKAAAALSTLDVLDEAGEKKDVDNKALDKAMKGLNIKDQKKTEKAVKIEATDIALVVAELELSRQKATELLRAHDGNAVKAMAAFINGAA